MIAASMRCCSALCVPLVAALLALASPPAAAHKASDAYLQLAVDDAGAASLRVDVALRDLDAALELDADADGRLTWGEVRAAWPAIERYVRAHVEVARCEFAAAPARALERRVDGAYAALAWRGTCRGEPAVRYTVLADVDPTHRGLLRVDRRGAATALSVLDPTQPLVVDRAAPPAGPRSFVAEGVRHILTGWDHLVFLLCLLLPAVMRRTDGAGWRPVARLREALLPVLGLVTAFTLAHSVTLALAASKLVALSPSVIEPAIAATIVLAAIDNVRPLFAAPRALVAFAFGLVHGFGFAGVLAELDLPASRFAWALLQFNAGLELGQAAVVAAAIAALFGARAWRGYPGWVIRGGSVAALALGVAWFVERAADVSLWPL